MAQNEKMIRNEQVIRDRNRAVGDSIKKYFRNNKEAVEAPLDFMCECSDLQCEERVSVSIKNYEKLHKQNNRFLIVKGHKTPAIEKTIKQLEGIVVVEKSGLAA